MASYSIEPETGIYPRDQGTHRSRLAAAIANLYGVGRCELLTSGINTIYTVLDCLALHFEKGTFFISQHLFGGTRTVIQGLRLRHPRIRFSCVDIYEINPNTLSKCKVLFLESCSNPDGYIFDPSNFRYLAPDAYVVVDNTWLSPALFNPFSHGASIVVESCAKYLSGGRCIMGSACFRTPEDPIAKRVRSHIKIMGIHIATPYCEIVLDSLTSLTERTHTAAARMLTAIAALQEDPRVDRINYPIIHSPDLMQYLKTNPGVVYFHIQVSPIPDEPRAYTGTRALSAGLQFRTSFGHADDSIDIYAKKNPTGLWIRLATGIPRGSGFYPKAEAVFGSIIKIELKNKN